MICTVSEFVLKIIGKRCSVGKKKLAVLFIAQYKVVRIKLRLDIFQREALTIGCLLAEQTAKIRQGSAYPYPL